MVLVQAMLPLTKTYVFTAAVNGMTTSLSQSSSPPPPYHSNMTGIIMGNSGGTTKRVIPS
jgi:hypothetical protein